MNTLDSDDSITYPLVNDSIITQNSRYTAINGVTSPVVVKFLRDCQKSGLQKSSVCDYGCGHRRNGLLFLNGGFNVTFYDINRFGNEVVQSLSPETKFDVILLNYILNVVTPDTRISIIEHVKSLCTSSTLILVEVRGRGQIQREMKRSTRQWNRFEDGFLVPGNSIRNRFTFQKGYSKGELQQFLSSLDLSIVKVYSNSKVKISLVASVGSQ